MQAGIGTRKTQMMNGEAYGVRMLGAALVVNRIIRYFRDI